MNTQPKRILITGAGGAAAVSFMKALADTSHKLLAADMDPYAAGLYLVPAAQRLLLPRGDDPAFMGALLEACLEHNVDVLVPTVDAELIPIARHRMAFEAAGVQLLLANDDTLTACLDKWALYEACKDVVRMPYTVVLDEGVTLWDLTFPVIAKPRRGSGGTGVRLIEHRWQLRDLPFDGTMILQEYLPGAEFSVDVLATGDGVVRAMVPRERLKVDSGIAVTSRSVHHLTLEALGRRVAEHIGLTFVGNIQFRFDRKGRPALLEVNPRFPGTMPLTVASGVNMPLLSLNNLLGINQSTEPCSFTPVAVVRYWQERFLPCEELAAIALPQPLPTARPPRTRRSAAPALATV